MAEISQKGGLCIAKEISMKVTEYENKRLPYLRDKTSKLTLSPGCYIMKNEKGKIIYIGKAKSLRKRVTSYFRASADHLPKVAKMVSMVYDYDFIVTDSEFEALVLECSLIKQNMPRYNILLKDDKGYSYIKITNEEYPRISAALQKDDDNAVYIGPYTSSYAVKQAVEEANNVFKLPTCHKVFPRDFRKARPCLNHHINKCMGLCRGKISKEDYREIINQAVDYMKNGSAKSVERLTSLMEEASEALDFEQAAKLRDRIRSIEKISENQKIIDENMKDADIIALAENVEIACASVLMYRGGRLFDKVSFMLGEIEDTKQMRGDFLYQFYADKADIPKNIFLDGELEDLELAERFLREKSGRAVHIKIPQRGNIMKLVEMARANAGEQISIKIGRTGKEVIALDELSKLLGLPNPPKYIECYDISNLASANMVAGMVVFKNARPFKKNYKKFTIKTVFEQNDYACMQEVIERRIKRYLDSEETDEGFKTLPDLIFLDGGKGHVNAVSTVLEKYHLNIPLYGLVKDSKHRTRAIATGGGEISVSQMKSAFNLITRIQDEVHRYAITFQASKHKKNTYQLELTKVKGIGDAKAKKLIMHFKTKEALKKASISEIKSVIGGSEQQLTELKNIIDNMK